MTAEELLEKYRFEAGEHIGNRDYDKMCEFAKEFAAMHVKAALRAADNKAEVIIVDWDDRGDFKVPTYGVDSDSILNSYPLTNIK